METNLTPDRRGAARPGIVSLRDAREAVDEFMASDLMRRAWRPHPTITKLAEGMDEYVQLTQWFLAATRL
jgi:hypothetical protein